MALMRRLVTDVAVVVTALMDVSGEEMELGQCWAPKSMIYLALGCELDYWYRLEGVLVKLGWCEVTSEVIRLTELGLEKAKEIDAVLEKAG